MGIAFLLMLGITFLLGGAIAFVPLADWQGALRVELGLVCFTVLLAIAWGLRVVWHRRSWSGDGWAEGVGALALGAVLISFTLGEGPGRIAPVVDRSIDLGGWWLAMGGVAAAGVAMIFGALATRRVRLLRALPGVMICGLGLLSVQPALAAAGWPTVGPFGLLFAGGAAVGYRFIRRG